MTFYAPIPFKWDVFIKQHNACLILADKTTLPVFSNVCR